MPIWAQGVADRLSLLSLKPNHPILFCPTSLAPHTVPFIKQFFKSTPDFPISNLEISLFNDDATDLSPSLNAHADHHDLIILSPFLHKTYDVPGILAQAYTALKPGGFFIAPLFGQDTLHELKTSMAQTDLIHFMGISQRFLPTIQTKDAGALLQRARFDSITADIDHHHFPIHSVSELIGRLRDSGQNISPFSIQLSTFNIDDKKLSLSKEYLHDLNYYYSENFKIASIDIIYMCGWKPIHTKTIENKKRPKLFSDITLTTE